MDRALVRTSAEQALNALLDAEADALCGARRYERFPDRLDACAGSSTRRLHAKAGKLISEAIREARLSIDIRRERSSVKGVTRRSPGVRKQYPSDLTDDQWALIEPLLPPAKPGGRPREVDLREVLNALFYQARTGCQWDFLPHDLIPKGTAYDYFARWQNDGTWPRVVDALRGRVRAEAGRQESPSAALIDSQTVKTTERGGESGYDGGKKLKGRKRHLVTDTMGLLLAVAVTAANLDDGTHAPEVLSRLDLLVLPRLEVVFGDNKYNNRALDGWLEETAAPYRVESVQSAKKEGRFKPQKLRWAVERTIAWLGRCRRLSKDYEYNTSASEAWVSIAAIQQMTRRLRPNRDNPLPEFTYPKKEAAAA